MVKRFAINCCMNTVEAKLFSSKYIRKTIQVASKLFNPLLGVALYQLDATFVWCFKTTTVLKYAHYLLFHDQETSYSIGFLCVYVLSCKNTFGIKKMQPSKLESYLKLKAWTDWWQQDLISEWGLAYWTHDTTLDTL